MDQLRKKKVTVIGSLNIDHVFEVRKLPFKGETIISKSYQLRCGGKGANQAAAIGRLGATVTMIGKLGDDEASRMQISSLRSSKVNTSGIIIDKGQKTGAAFVTVDEKGNNTIVLYPGINRMLTTVDIDLKKQLILDSDIVVLQMEIPVKTNCHVIRFAAKNNKKIILNLAPAIEIDKTILGMVDFLIVNDIEIKFLCKTEFDTKNIKSSIAVLRKFYKNNIVITLGKLGSVLLDSNDNVYSRPAYNIEAIDTTAAGDAFIGGFVKGLIEGFSFKDCLSVGNATAAISVTKLGAQFSLPFKEDLDDFLIKNNSITGSVT